MNKKIEKDISEYFDKESPNPNMETFRKIKENIYKNNQKNVILKWKYIIPSIFISIIAVLSIILTIIHVNKKPDENPTKQPSYYMDNELSELDTDSNFMQQFIQNNYDKYLFIFSDEYEIEKCTKYSKDENIKMIKLKLFKNSPPFTELELVLITDNYLVYNYDNNFKKSATISTTNNYTMYYTKNEGIYSNQINVLFEYQTYRLYLTFNTEDLDFLEKFK